MGNLMPGQNLSLPPPYVIGFSAAGESAEARIDQLTRTITVYRRQQAPPVTTATWTLYPRNARAEIGSQPLVSGTTEINLTGDILIKLTAPDGTLNKWKIVIVPLL